MPDHPESAESTETQEQSVMDNPDSVSNALHFQALGHQQTGTAPGSSLLNPFGFLLLRILGGASSDSTMPFFSTFRDVPDQGQGFAENPQHENETRT